MPIQISRIGAQFSLFSTLVVKNMTKYTFHIEIIINKQFVRRKQLHFKMNLLQTSLLFSIASSALGQTDGSWDFDNENKCSTQRTEHEGRNSFCETKVSIDYRLLS